MALGADTGPSDPESGNAWGAGTCHRCGADLVVGGRYCWSCGTDRAAAVGADAVRRHDRPEERRTVTVLFADLSGYTSVAERMDPETVKASVSGILERLAVIVTDHGGHVDKFIGDNVMAIFGAPSAHEDDAERAVRAGLAMQAAMERINEGVQGPMAQLQLRIGINTGEVLAGWMGNNYTVMGDAVNVAARLQAEARPGSVVVGEATAAETSGTVTYRDLGQVTLKGKSDPVTAREAVAVDSTRRRRPLVETPLVGRSAELGALERLFADVTRTRRASVVVLRGEPGVGKSRLVGELVRRLRDRSDPEVTVRWGASLPYGATDPYWVIGEVLRQECDAGDSDHIDAMAGKLAHRLDALIDDEPLRRRTLSTLLPLLGAAPVGLTTDDPDEARHATFGAVRVVLSAMARQAPVIVVLEDLHWADRNALELIGYLAGALDAPVMLVCTARPELADLAGMATPDHSLSVLELGPLGRDDIVALVNASVGRDVTSDHVRTVVDRSGGNPLFAEELIRHIRELPRSDRAPVPTTLQALLLARLDTLPPAERHLVQRASVLGPSFSLETLEMAVDADAEVGLAVRNLVEKGYLEARGPELSFHHELLRDAAYAMLPKAERARQHLAAADVLERQAADGGDQALGVLAEHYLRAVTLAEEALLPADVRDRAREGALRLLVAAGDRSGGLSAYEEAMAQYEAAASLTSEGELLVDLYERIGDTAMRLGDPGKAIEAWERAQSLLTVAAPERLAELDRKLGRSLVDCGAREQAIERYEIGIRRLVHRPPSAGLIRLFEDAAALYMEEGENMLAIYTGEKALRVAEQLHATAAATRAHLVFGMVLGRMGDHAGARRNFDRALELVLDVDDATSATVLRAYGHHLHAHESDRASAAERFHAALELAQGLGDVPLQAGLAGELGELALHAAEWEQVDRLAQECEQLRVESARPGRRATPLRLRAWGRWRRGEVGTALELLEQSYANARATGEKQPAVAALHAMAAIEQLRGEPDGAVVPLETARELCEGAGLLSSLLDIVALSAVVAKSRGRQHDAEVDLAELEPLVQRVQSPAAEAARTEAVGLVRADTDQLAAAPGLWLAIGRPVDAARCELHRAMALMPATPAEGRAALEEVAARFERLGVVPLAERARQLARHPT